MIKILSTRREDARAKRLAGRFKLKLESIPMIKTEFSCEPEEIKKVVEADKSKTIAFTSRTAVMAILRVPNVLDLLGQKSIYAIGKRTAAPLLEHGMKVRMAAEPNGKSLATTLIDDGVESVLFPCSQIRHADFPDELMRNKVTLNEWKVYKTVPTPLKIEEEDSEGVLFYSPSAVQSYFELNETVKKAFAIGESTAAELFNHIGKEQVMISPKPDFKVFIEFVHDHFVYSSRN